MKARNPESGTGDVDEPALETIDATGLVVCPGFINPRTHYDAQLFWDPHATPSNLFGVTSMINSNCGFTLALLDDDSDADYLMRMMVKVEDMSLEALEERLPGDWRTFGDHLDRLDERDLAVNVGFLVGHCALRRAAMKDAAVGRTATAEQVTAMRRILGESIKAGGLELSTSRSFTHNDWDSQPVPSRWATEDKVLELRREAAGHSDSGRRRNQ